MLDYENASADGDIRFERVGDVLTIKLPKEGFVRGAGNLLSSRPFWMLVALLLLIMNLGDLVRLASNASRGKALWTELRPEYITLIFFHPALLICMYAALVGQIKTTIYLYRTELVRSTRSPFTSARESGYARGEIVGVDTRWMMLAITLDCPGTFKMRCHRVILFYGRSREERDRVATAIRNWVEQTPAEQRR